MKVTTIAGLVPGIGLIALAIYNVSQKDYASAIANLIAGLAAFGLPVGAAKFIEQKRQFKALQLDHDKLKMCLNKKGMI